MKIKQNFIPLFAITAASVLTLTAHAQFAANWSTIDGGGGTSTGGAYALSGTVGQPDVGRATGGNYTLAGGFWSIIPDGLPPLKVKKRAGQLVLSWRAGATAVTVQSATQLAPGGGDWADFAANPVQVGDEFELTIGPVLTPPNPIRFFRLRSP